MSITKRCISLTLLLIYFLAFPLPSYVECSPLNGTISTEVTWQFPKVRRNAAGEYVVLFWDADVPELRFKKWNGSGWIDYTSISMAELSGASGLDNRDVVFYGNEYRVNFDFDSQNKLHVIFSAGKTALSTDLDGIHGVFDGSSWTFTLFADEENQPDHISLYIDSNDKLHLAYVVDRVSPDNDNLLKYATNNDGSWSSFNIIDTDNRGIDELHDTYIVVSASGTVTVLYRREDNQNSGLDNYYEVNSQDYSNFSTPALVLDGGTDNAMYQIGNLTLNHEDNPAFVYTDLTNSIAYYTYKGSGSWITEQLDSSTATIIAALDLQKSQSKLYALTATNTGYLYQTKPSDGSWQDGEQFLMPGFLRDRFAILPFPQGFMQVSENSNNWTTYYHYFGVGVDSFPWFLFMPAINAAEHRSAVH